MSFGETLHRPALRTSERDRRCSQRANLQMSSILGIVLISVCALFIPNSSKRRLGYSPEPVVEGASRWSSERRTLPEHMLQRRGHKGFRPIFDSFTSAVGGGISGRPAYESTRDATRTGKAFAKAGGASGDAVSNKSTSRTTRGRPEMSLEYKERRERVLKEIGGGEGAKDKSPKGSIDAPIVDLISEINACPGGRVYTTSSCSGRITVFTQGASQRKGGHWSICSHDKVNAEDVLSAIHSKNIFCISKTDEKSEGKDEAKGTENRTETSGTLSTFRFEPFILCCECDSLETAYRVLGAANQSGMRESGIMGGSKRFLVGVRCSLRLEVPVRLDGKPLITPDYTRFLVAQANAKFDENLRKVEAFRKAFFCEFYPKKIEEKKMTKDERKNMEIVCSRSSTKLVKDYLKSISAILPRTRVRPATEEDCGEGNRMVIPLLPGVSFNANDTETAIKKFQEKDHKKKKKKNGKINEKKSKNADVLPLKIWIQQQREGISSGYSQKATQVSSPWERMRLVISAMVGESAAALLPKKWQMIGDIVLLPSGEWLKTSVNLGQNTLISLGMKLWSTIAQELGAKRVAIKGEVQPGIIRPPEVRIVWRGDDKTDSKLPKGGWVTHKEGGVYYCLDVTRSMFCAGNGTEKKRVGEICRSGDIVVDLYAGIGYFVLPYLVHGKAKHVIACEINPASVEGLQKALKLNNVEDRCTIHPRDNKLLKEKNIADRVNLGLLPSSEKGWPIAVQILKPSGGFLHVHGNCLDAKVEDYAKDVAKAIEELSQQSDDLKKKSWKIRVVHIEKVKWYAPRVRHVVIDLECRPSSLN
eukprot:CAMPEP_0167742950 /NCGR_PEP_ID=MMETSP0110_2-20121227/1734_1 /TAXON_ID=629695 /ORGANISM="Gymnochlora sp., Strain CCMP2014" /LENGTH=815 /DNA_ID=CAMNT_0007627245 /DNA_START=1489 /DNA_END=3936 /DNA_ORIENTATION=-